MFIQKAFHLHHNLEQTKDLLSDLRTYRRAFENVRAAATGDGVAHFEFVTGNGFRADVELVGLLNDEPNQILFRSCGGNMDLAGLVEFVPIREDLTEVQITLEYAIKSPMHSVLDAITASVDRFVNRQLRRLQAHFAGEPHVVSIPCVHSHEALVGQPQLAH